MSIFQAPRLANGVDVEPTNWTAFAAQSRELERFRQRDFGSIPAAVRTLLPGMAGLILYPLPLVTRVSKDLAKHHLLPPVYTFDGASSTVHAELLERSAHVLRMLSLQERMVPQQAALVSVLPGTGGKLRVAHWLPYEAKIQLVDHMDEELRNAGEISLRWPIGGTWNNTTADAQWIPVFSTATFTRRECYVLEVDGKTKRGLWDPSKPGNLSHPLGFVPIVGMRQTEPLRGLWYPSVCEDLHAIQIGLILALSDILHTARKQSHAQAILTGPGATAMSQEMPTGPDILWTFDTNKGGGGLASDYNFQLVTGNPPLEKYLQALETTLKYFGRYNYLPDEAMVTSAVLTGMGLRELTQSQREERMRTNLRLQAFEGDLIRLMCEVNNADAHRLVKVPVPARVEVDYRFPTAPENGLQEQQAAALAFSLGTDSASELTSRALGTSREESLDLVQQRLEEHRDLAALRITTAPGGAPAAAGDGTPGLDAIAGQRTDLNLPAPGREDGPT